MKTIGERIRQAREAHKMSGEALAKKVGYKNQSAIGNLENRIGGSGGSKLGVIADALNVPLEWLMRGPDTDNDKIPFRPDSSTQAHAFDKTPETTSHSVQEQNGPYGVFSQPSFAGGTPEQNPFLLFSLDDWMLLDEKERLQFEGEIAYAILQIKKTRRAQ